MNLANELGVQNFSFAMLKHCTPAQIAKLKRIFQHTVGTNTPGLCSWGVLFWSISIMPL